MLTLDHQPIEAGVGKEFGHVGAAQPQKTANRRCAGLNLLADPVCAHAKSSESSEVFSTWLADANLTQIGARALGDGERLIKRRRVHVLLDNGPTVEVDLGQHVTKSQEIHGD